MPFSRGRLVSIIALALYICLITPLAAPTSATVLATNYGKPDAPLLEARVVVKGLEAELAKRSLSYEVFRAKQESGHDDGDDERVAKQQRRKQNEILSYSHGAVMAAVFVLGFPMGAIFMPMLSNWAVHASWQMFWFTAMWAGFGLGYVFASRHNNFFSQPHTQLGVVVCALMGLQPLLGWLHHRHFIKAKQRGFASYIHRWGGRCLIVLGVVNGGLGLQMAAPRRTFTIVYCIATAVVAGIIVAVAMMLRRRKRANMVYRQ